MALIAGVVTSAAAPAAASQGTGVAPAKDSHVSQLARDWWW